VSDHVPGYVRSDDFASGLTKVTLPPLLIAENFRIHNDLESFAGLLKYANMPMPVAMFRVSAEGVDSDYFAAFLIPGLREFYGCKLVMDGDNPLFVIHGHDCLRNRLVHAALQTGQVPETTGLCKLDPILEAGVKGERVRIPTISMFEDEDYDDTGR